MFIPMHVVNTHFHAFSFIPQKQVCEDVKDAFGRCLQVVGEVCLYPAVFFT